MKRLITIVLICVMLSSCHANSHGNTSPVTPPSESTGTLPTSTSAATLPQKALIDQILEEMTLEEKIGQLFLARCPKEDAAKAVMEYHLGGLTLYAQDFQDQTPDSAKTAIQSYQTAAKISLFIAVDEEGGHVCRVSSNSAFRSEPFDYNRNLYALGGLELIHTTEIEKSQLLRSLGINVNLAPVCDITTDENSYMYPRSLGQSPQITGEFIKTVISAQKNSGIGGVLKHFPGYGNNTDTHMGIAVDTRSLETLEAYDLIPFSVGIQSGCDAIMVSHTFVNCLDSELPASLSPAVHRYMRDTMGFAGVIVTDDLSMKAITDLYGAVEAAVMALECGNDLLCATDFVTQYEAVLSAVKNGRVSEETVNAAVKRILLWKQSIGLIQS